MREREREQTLTDVHLLDIRPASEIKVWEKFAQERNTFTSTKVFLRPWCHSTSLRKNNRLSLIQPATSNDRSRTRISTSSWSLAMARSSTRSTLFSYRPRRGRWNGVSLIHSFSFKSPILHRTHEDSRLIATSYLLSVFSFDYHHTLNSCMAK